MPGKLCFATLAAFLFLFEDGIAQQLVSPTLGEGFAGAASSIPPAPAPRNARNETHVAPTGEPSHLVRPAVHQTPDRDIHSVQQTGFSSPPGKAAPLQDRDPSAAGGPDLESPDGKSSDRDQGFPALEPPGESRLGGDGTVPVVQGLGSVVTVSSSLAIVLGLFFVTAWLMRRTGSGGLASLPDDVFEVLGRAPLNQRQQVHLVRCGTKLLLVSLTPDSAETLTEIDDPDEVTRLAGLCRANPTGSTSAGFGQVLQQFAGQPAEPGFVGRTDSRTMRAELPQKLEDLHG